jgi:hypothetical protein
MIEATMYAALGFLVATFLGLMLVPAIGRRADRLARRRAEAAFPLSLEQVAAERDHLRGELAVRERAIEQKAERNLTLKAQSLEHAGRRDLQLSELKDILTDRETEAQRLNADLSEARRDRDMTHERLDAESVSLAVARQERDTIEAKGDILAAELSSALSMLKTMQDDLANRTHDLDTTRTRLADVEVRHGTLTLQREATQEALETAREKIAVLESELGAAQKVATSWKDHHTVSETARADWEAQSIELQSRLNAESLRCRSLQQKLGEIETAFMMRGQELSQERSQLKAKSIEHDVTRRELRELNAVKTTLEREKAASERAGVQRETMLQRDIERVTTKLAVWEQKSLSSNHDHEQSQSALADLRTDRARLAQEVKQVRKDAERLEADIRSENTALRTEIGKVADIILQRYKSRMSASATADESTDSTKQVH